MVVQQLDDLVEAGEAVKVVDEGWKAPGYLAADARIPRRLETTALLSPFDPVVWERDRTERMFGFRYRIEIYTPAPRRVYGYYSLPVLVGDDLVGRVDLKADRGSSRLLVQSAWWEHGAPAHAAESLADELRAAALWQGLEEISVGRWGDAADGVAAALGAPRHDRGTG